MASPANLRFDVSSQVPEDGVHEMAAWLFLPAREAAFSPPRVIVAVPGGGYSKAYYHMIIPGHPSYSFGEHMAAKGYVVVALDHVGIGESTRLRDGDLIDLELMAACVDAATTQIRDRLRTGDLSPELAPSSEVIMVGIGHSVGAAVMTVSQARYETFDGVGILGTTNLWPKHIQSLPDDHSPESLRESTIANLKRLIGEDRWNAVYFKVDRSQVRDWFHWDDVPDAVVEADNAAATHTARMAAVDAQTPMKRRAMAATITVPVLVALGELDVSPSPKDEPGVFSGSVAVTHFIQPRAAHCHNFASTRHAFWDRIGDWIQTLSPERGPSASS